MSTQPSQPLRILACWSGDEGARLHRALAKLITTCRLSLNLVPIHELGGHVQQAGYYHILVIPAEDFGCIDPLQIQRCIKRISLILILPGQLDQSQVESWFPQAQAGIAFQSDPGTNGAIDFLVNLCASLIEGHVLREAIDNAYKATVTSLGSAFVRLSDPDMIPWPGIQKPPISPKQR